MQVQAVVVVHLLLVAMVAQVVQEFLVGVVDVPLVQVHLLKQVVTVVQV